MLVYFYVGVCQNSNSFTKNASINNNIAAVISV